MASLPLHYVSYLYDLQLVMNHLHGGPATLTYQQHLPVCDGTCLEYAEANGPGGGHNDGDKGRDCERESMGDYQGRGVSLNVAATISAPKMERF